MVLSDRDKKVVDAFIDRRADESKKLRTDGVRLDGLWMGGTNIASWENRKIVFHDLGSRAAQTVQRAMAKRAPRNVLAENPGRFGDLPPGPAKFRLTGPNEDDVYRYGPASIEISGPVGGMYGATIRLRGQEKDIEGRSREQLLNAAMWWVDTAPELARNPLAGPAGGPDAHAHEYECNPRRKSDARGILAGPYKAFRLNLFPKKGQRVFPGRGPVYEHFESEQLAIGRLQELDAHGLIDRGFVTDLKTGDVIAENPTTGKEPYYDRVARAWLMPDGRDAIAVLGSCQSCGTRPVATTIDEIDVCHECAKENGYPKPNKRVPGWTPPRGKPPGVPNPGDIDVDKIVILNAREAVSNKPERLWLFQFGAYGTTYVAVWDGYRAGLDGSLETAAEYLAEHAPGHITSEEEMGKLYQEVADELGVPWPPAGRIDWDDKNIQKVTEQAEADMTRTESGWLTSYEWYVNELSPGDDLYKEIFEKTADEIGDLDIQEFSSVVALKHRLKIDTPWPTVDELAADLLRASKELAAMKLDEEESDVRLRVFGGGWTLMVGDAQYDPDHRGWWGTGRLLTDGSLDRREATTLAEDMILEALEDATAS